MIPAKFREKYSELVVGRRRRRQDRTAEEARQQVSAVGLVSSLWSSETGAREQLKIHKKNRNLTFVEDLESYFQDDK